ncbi:hypothetical protein MPSI1_002167 [Malassezia psittaci]|uniref:D-isomer specific 2-hydroxyacid dehydrogenase NAD-binding domain-containing protein n=1 Tax=Malassezia psittaci TaxID=1821823 RepID=A0AAF0F9S2_9BASI|nr:hypothetical protein MPSI1_002167 [Malassezia psittaci]
MPSERPLVVLSSEIPGNLLKDASEKGKIELRIWKPGKGDEKRTCAPREWVMDNIQGASALLVQLQIKVDEELLQKAGESLKVVSTMSVGYDHIDLEACAKHNVRLGYTPGVLNEAVADTALLLTLMVTRHASTAHRLVIDGQWPSTPMRPLTMAGPSVQGKTIGFLGFGEIAQCTARRFMAFRPKRIVYTASKPKPFDPHSDRFQTFMDDMLSAYHDKHKKLPVEVENIPDLRKMAAEADILIVIANYTKSTHHAINADVLKNMKKTAYVVNVARGPLIDTDALVDALKHDQIAGAGLDVIEGEPNITPDHAILSEDLNDKVVLLPHIGSATYEARQGMARLAELNLLGGLHLREDGPADKFDAEIAGPK